MDPCSPNGYDPVAVAGPDREKHPNAKAQPAPSDDQDRSAAPESAAGSTPGQERQPAVESEGEGAQPTLPDVDTAPRAGSETPDQGPGKEATSDALAGAYQLKLDVFEGPLDLLLHLIRKHELDILDIPVGFITEKYLEYLDLMHSFHIDVVSEYLVIAATLTYIKSKMLLPPDPSLEEGEDGELFDSDPRADLVRRLLEYQKYKHTAAQLGDRPRLDRDTFARGTDEPVDPGPTRLAPLNVFRLFDAFEQVLKRAHQTADHHILFERVSITERIIELTELLSGQRRVRFADLFTTQQGGPGAIEQSRLELVVTFLALLEMCKMGVATIAQDEGLEDFHVEFAAKRLAGDAIPQAAPEPAADEGMDHEWDDRPEPRADDQGAAVQPEPIGESGRATADTPATDDEQPIRSREAAGGSDGSPASGDDSETP